MYSEGEAKNAMSDDEGDRGIGVFFMYGSSGFPATLPQNIVIVSVIWAGIAELLQGCPCAQRQRKRAQARYARFDTRYWGTWGSKRTQCRKMEKREGRWGKFLFNHMNSEV